MEIDLSDKIVLITGVGGGIGTAFLEHFIGKPKALISSSRTADVGLSNNDKLNFRHYTLDLTEEKNVKKLFNKIEDEFGRLDIFINTIGGSLFSHKIEDFPLEEFNTVIQVNLTSAFLLTQEAIKLMKKGRGGNIVHIVSSSAKKISKKKAPYGIAKAGLIRLIHYAAAEIAEYNIVINGVTPTYVFTQRHELDIAKKILETGQTRKEVLDYIYGSQLIKKSLFPFHLIPLLEVLITTDCITGQVMNCAMGEVLSL